MTKRIALDHDSTLAATGETAMALLRSDVDYYTDATDWDWGPKEFGLAPFLSSVWHAWTLRPLEVPPMESGLAETVGELYDHFDVHVVTAHPDHMGITEGKEAWLDAQGIPYDEFHVVPTDTTKAALGYDFYIDDKPHLPTEVNRVDTGRVFLRDQPYNRDAEGDYDRVYSVAEALDLLRLVA